MYKVKYNYFYLDNFRILSNVRSLSYAIKIGGNDLKKSLHNLNTHI